MGYFVNYAWNPVLPNHVLPPVWTDTSPLIPALPLLLMGTGTGWCVYTWPGGCLFVSHWYCSTDCVICVHDEGLWPLGNINIVTVVARLAWHHNTEFVLSCLDRGLCEEARVRGVVWKQPPLPPIHIWRHNNNTKRAFDVEVSKTMPSHAMAKSQWNGDRLKYHLKTKFVFTI